MDDRTQLEERVAHLTRALEDLSDIVARQDRDLAQATQRIEMLMRREAERAAAEGGAVALGDEKPPHW